MAYGLSILTSSGFESIEDIYSARIKQKVVVSLPGATYTPGQRYDWSFSSLSLSFDETKDVWFMGQRAVFGTVDTRWTVDFAEGLFVPFADFFSIDTSNNRFSYTNNTGATITFGGSYDVNIHILRVKG